MKPSSRLRSFLLLVSVTASSSAVAQSTYTWTQDAGGAQSWNTATNWDTDPVVPSPVSGDIVDFSTLNILANTTLTLEADRTAELWKFGDTTGTTTWTVNAGNSITLAGTTPTIQVNNGTANLKSVVDGTQGLTKTNGGTLILEATNTYTGNTTISGGTLQIGSNNTSGSTLGNAGTYAGDISIAATSSKLIFNTNTSQELSGIISGDGTLQKGGSGTLTLTGANTYTGKTTIAAPGAGGPTMSISSFNSVNSNGIDPGIPSFTSSSLGAPTTVANGTIDLGSGSNTRSCTLIYTGAGETTDRVMKVSFNASATQTIQNSGGGLLKFTSTFTINPSSGSTTAGLRLRGSNDGEIAGGLGATPIPGILRKMDAGSWTLGGDSTADTVVVENDGTLIVNGTLTADNATTPTISVNGTSTLGGSGTVTGDVTVAAGASLTPGNSVGTLDIDGTLDISAPAGGAGLLNFELGPIASSDQIAVTGNLTIGVDSLGLSDFDLSDLPGLENGNYVLISSGTLTALNTVDPADKDGTLGGGTTELKVIGNDIVLTVSGLAGGTPFDTWAGTGTLGLVTFDGDTNGDSVQDGLAFLLGVANPDDNALGLLPTVTETGGGLVMTFTMLDSASRGTASLNVEHSSDLGISDAWTTVAVTDGNSGPTDGVTFLVSGSGTLNVEATIGSGESAAGKLFGRLQAENP